jgi:hypothetical protein
MRHLGPEDVAEVLIGHLSKGYRQRVGIARGSPDARGPRLPSDRPGAPGVVTVNQRHAAAAHRDTLQLYCVGCHSARIKSGGLALDGVPGSGELLSTATSGYMLRATEPERARLLCLSHAGIEDVAVTDGQIRFSGDDAAVAVLSVALGQARIGVTALIPETASLEDLFIGLTGGESSDHDREAVA